MGSIILGSIFLLLFIYSIIAYIKRAYREYDRRETLKETKVEYRAKIKQAEDYFRNTYNNNVYLNVKTNIDFCLKIIYNRSKIEDQIKGLKNLYDILYETGYRLKVRYDDVNFIITPLKNLRGKLFEEQMDFIKNNSEENILNNNEL